MKMKWFALVAVLGFAEIYSTHGAECESGTTWRTGCYDCTCSEAGRAVCTPLQTCDVAINTSADIPHCQPGSRWRDDCNTCFCTSSGVAACTKIGCVSIKPPAGLNFDDTKTPNESVSEGELGSGESHNRVKRQVCTPNSNFLRECNVCKCDREGASYACTQNECMERGRSGNRDVEVFMENEGIDHIEQESVCHSRTTFQINCNTCVCNADGTDYRCTEKACPLPADVELFKELKDETRVVPLRKCDPSGGGVFQDACNECRCNADGTDYTCTKNVCKGRHSRKAEEGKSALNKTVVCEAKMSFRKECNMCWCNDDGTSYFCTRRVCVPNLDEDSSEQPEEQRVIEKECRPREVFELDCNTCRCNDDGKSFNCTGRGCATEPPPDEVFYEIKNSAPVESREKRQTEPSKSDLKVCEPGVQFRQDCNTCLCHTDGLSFSCTRHECNKPPQTNAAPAATRRRRRRRRREVAKKEARDCEPGSVFEQGCNVCICASDGQHATCALKRCPVTHKDSDDKAEADNGFRCTAGEQFKRACNDCTCSADGRSIFCTIKLCDKEIVSQL